MHGWLMRYTYEDDLTAVLREGGLAAMIAITLTEIDWVIVASLVIDVCPLLDACHTHFAFTFDVDFGIGIHSFPPLQVGQHELVFCGLLIVRERLYLTALEGQQHD